MLAFFIYTLSFQQKKKKTTSWINSGFSYQKKKKKYLVVS